MIFIGPQIKLGLIKLLGHRPAAVGGLSWGLRRSQKQHLESCERLHDAFGLQPLEGDDDTWTHWVRHCRSVRKLEKLACAFPRVPGHCRHQYSAGTLRHFGTLLGTLGTICGSFAGILGEYLEFFWQFGAFLGHF